MTLQQDDSLRTVANYAADVRSLSHGVKEKCIFNELPFFHIATNVTCDMMHDFYLGICRYDMARIIFHCVKQQYVTFDHLNDRLKYFDYSELDRGNHISSVNIKQIRNGYLILTAGEMSALMSYFGVLVGDLVPPDDEVWELYLILYDIIDLITSLSISSHDVSYIRQLIKCHN